MQALGSELATTSTKCQYPGCQNRALKEIVQSPNMHDASKPHQYKLCQKHITIAKQIGASVEEVKKETPK